MTSTFARGICTLRNRDEINTVMGSIKKRDLDGLYASKILVPTKNRRMKYTKKLENNSVPEKHNQAVLLWHTRMAHTNPGIIREMIQAKRYGMKARENMRRN